MTQVISSSPGRYVPAANEPYMSQAQIDYFRSRLRKEKAALSRKISCAIQKIKSLEGVQADILDRSNAYIDLELEVKSYERYSTRMKQIERALGRIEEGSFGYCELTGNEIGLRRLEAIPFATMSINALEEFEARQKVMYPAPARPLFS